MFNCITQTARPKTLETSPRTRKSADRVRSRTRAVDDTRSNFADAIFVVRFPPRLRHAPRPKPLRARSTVAITLTRARLSAEGWGGDVYFILTYDCYDNGPPLVCPYLTLATTRSRLEYSSLYSKRFALDCSLKLACITRPLYPHCCKFIVFTVLFEHRDLSLSRTATPSRRYNYRRRNLEPTAPAKHSINSCYKSNRAYANLEHVF